MRQEHQREGCRTQVIYPPGSEAAVKANDDHIGRIKETGSEDSPFLSPLSILPADALCFVEGRAKFAASRAKRLGELELGDVRLPLRVSPCCLPNLAAQFL